MSKNDINRDMSPELNGLVYEDSSRRRGKFSSYTSTHLRHNVALENRIIRLASEVNSGKRIVIGPSFGASIYRLLRKVRNHTSYYSPMLKKSLKKVELAINSKQIVISNTPIRAKKLAPDPANLPHPPKVDPVSPKKTKKNTVKSDLSSSSLSVEKGNLAD